MPIKPIIITIFGLILFLHFVQWLKSCQKIFSALGKPLKLKKIFEGNVHILLVKSRPGAITSNALLIYDSAQRGLLCSVLRSDRKGWLCGATSITKTNVTPEDQSDLVTQAFLDAPLIVINFEKQKDVGRHRVCHNK